MKHITVCMLLHTAQYLGRERAHIRVLSVAIATDSAPLCRGCMAGQSSSQSSPHPARRPGVRSDCVAQHILSGRPRCLHSAGVTRLRLRHHMCAKHQSRYVLPYPLHYLQLVTAPALAGNSQSLAVMAETAELAVMLAKQYCSAPRSPSRYTGARGQ